MSAAARYDLMQVANEYRRKLDVEENPAELRAI
jgi:hypothetical protein